MKIAVELLFYQDIENLKRLIPTIYEYVDIIFAIDGRHFTSEKYYDISTDGSRELLSSYDNIMVITRHDYEYCKRQYVCNLCRLYGFSNLVIIDSDEYVIGNWDDFKKNWENAISSDTSNYGLYRAQIQRLDAPYAYNWQPILWRNPWEFIYQGRHDYFRRNNETPTHYIRSYQNVEGIKFNHDHLLRTSEHLQVRQKQIEWQQKVDTPL